MMQPPQTQSFGNWAHKAIAKHYKKILSHEAGVLADRDPEELHQMRVGMRRLRSVLLGFAPALVLPEALTPKQVGRYGRVLGKLRDVDVITLTFRERYLPQLPTVEVTILEIALKKLAKRRQKQLTKVRKFLNSARYGEFKGATQAWLDQPQYQAIASVDIQLILPDLLLPQLSELLLHPGWWVGYSPKKLSKKQLETLFATDSPILHDLRKAAKRSRYTMEIFAPFYGENYANQLQAIKKVQTLIGLLQDDAVLQAFLEKTLGKTFDQELPTLCQIFHDNRHQTWHQWTKLQHQFLDAEYRYQLHQTLCQPQPRPPVAQKSTSN
ncbi:MULTISPECIES: CHAD domain-containing protein [Cyanophyceae]|uniref:CHAD domain-containing protein n=1 Tax=Cyanophyceae TaxID=3028117 RepID=UPI00059BF795|nr:MULTISPECIES: CHAD domain-containing protein [Cyanophyceae]